MNAVIIIAIWREGKTWKEWSKLGCKYKNEGEEGAYAQAAGIIWAVMVVCVLAGYRWIIAGIILIEMDEWPRIPGLTGIG